MNETALTERGTIAITLPEEVAIVRQQWIDTKRKELADAEVALEKLKGLGATEFRIRRVTGRVGILRKCVKALEAGFIPMPRFDSSRLQFAIEELPIKAIVAIDQARAHKIFDELRIVTGQEERSRQGRFGRRPPRDPLIVGVIRDAVETQRPANADRWWSPTRWSEEHHFLIAWWRPEDERPEDMF